MNLFIFSSLCFLSLIAVALAQNGLPPCTHYFGPSNVDDFIQFLANEEDPIQTAVICLDDNLSLTEPAVIRIPIVWMYPTNIIDDDHVSVTFAELEYTETFTIFEVEENVVLELHNLILEGALKFAVEAKDNSEVTLDNCILEDNLIAGAIQVSSGATLTIRDCVFRNNGQDGISGYNGGTCIVTDPNIGTYGAHVSISGSTFGYTSNHGSFISLAYSTLIYHDNTCAEATVETGIGGLCLDLYYSNATITESRFKDLSLTGADPARRDLDDDNFSRGAAAYLVGSSATFNDCVFDNLRADAGAGVFARTSENQIENQETDLEKILTFEHCTVNVCNADIGGFLVSIGATVNIRDCDFDENSALDAGVIYGFGGVFNIEGTKFLYSYAEDHGGVGLFTHLKEDTLVVNVDNCLFERNVAKESGGVFAFKMPQDIPHPVNNSLITITNSRFLYNRCTEYSRGRGGVLSYDYAKRFETIVQNCEFTNNGAGADGGGGVVSAVEYSDDMHEFYFTAYDSTFFDNYAGNTNAYDGNVMHLATHSKVFFKNCEFSAQDKWGQFLYFEGGPKAFNNCTFSTFGEPESRRKREVTGPGLIYNWESDSTASVSMGFCKFNRYEDTLFDDVHVDCTSETALILQYKSPYSPSVGSDCHQLVDAVTPSEFCMECKSYDEWLCKALHYCEYPSESYSFIDYEASILDDASASAPYVASSAESYTSASAKSQSSVLVYSLSSASVFSIRSRMSAIFDDPTLSAAYMSSSAANFRKNQKEEDTFPILPIALGAGGFLLLLLLLIVVLRRRRRVSTKAAGKSQDAPEVLSDYDNPLHKPGTTYANVNSTSSPVYDTPLSTQKVEYNEVSPQANSKAAEYDLLRNPEKTLYTDVASLQ